MFEMGLTRLYSVQSQERKGMAPHPKIWRTSIRQISYRKRKRKWYWRQQIWTKKEKIYTHDKKDTKHILTQGISVSWFDLRDETWRIGVTRSQGGLPSLFLSWDWMHYKYLYEDSKAEHAQISRDSALAHARCCISKSRAAHSPRCVIKWRQVITISKAKFEKWK